MKKELDVANKNLIELKQNLKTTEENLKNTKSKNIKSEKKVEELSDVKKELQEINAQLETVKNERENAENKSKDLASQLEIAKTTKNTELQKQIEEAQLLVEQTAEQSKLSEEKTKNLQEKNVELQLELEQNTDLNNEKIANLKTEKKKIEKELEASNKLLEETKTKLENAETNLKNTKSINVEVETKIVDKKTNTISVTKASANLSNYVMGWEAYVKTENYHIAYYDGSKRYPPKGYPTIGYGHLATDKHKLETTYTISGKKYRAMTHANVQKLVREDIRKREKYVMNAVVNTEKYHNGKEYVKGLGLSLNQGQFDALVSFGFGGVGRFYNSRILTVLREVPMSDPNFKSKLKIAFLSYSYSKTRRTTEYKMFVGEPTNYKKSNNLFSAYNPNKLVPF